MLVQTSDSFYIPRLLDAAVDGFLGRGEQHKPVLLVEGARQVGKTRLVQAALARCAAPVVSLNLERDALARAAIDACREFGEFAAWLRDEHGLTGADGRVLFIDEAQESLRLGGFVRFMKEEWPRASVILSGSTLTRLFRPDQRYPVGRIERLVVTPFAFSEYLLAHDREELAGLVRSGDGREFDAPRHGRLLALYDEFLRTGGLPAAVVAHAQGHDALGVLAATAADYEQDFLRIFGDDDLPLVRACLRAVANLVGSPFANTTVVPNASTPANERVNQMLDRLESWHLVLRAEQRGRSTGAAQGYRPKRYLFDTGLLRHLREAPTPSISVLDHAAAARDMLGGTIENQVAIDLARQHEPLTGWKQSSSGNEIDFLYRFDEHTTVPVECKAALRIDRRHLRGLRAYLDEYDAKLGALISCAPYDVATLENGARIVQVPVYCAENLAHWLAAPPIT